MIKTTWNVDDLALALYEYMEEQREFDGYSTNLFKSESNSVLMEIDKNLRSMMNYDKVEELFSLILEYSELRSKQYYIKGVETGISIRNITIEA